MDFKKVIESPEYNFLRDNTHLGKNVILLTLGGSYAYGTNNENSDVDVRGIALNSKSDILGMSNFEQVIDNATDTTIYSLKKAMSLFLSCCPNTIEMLGCKPEYYFALSLEGKTLIDNRKLFLSRKAINSFGGYAMQQFNRLENAMARDSYEQGEKENHIMRSCFSAMMSFAERYSEFPEGSINLSIGKTDKEDISTEIFADVNLHHYPLRDYNGIWAELNNIVKDYGKLNYRNRKKDAAHLNKHAMHLIRLYLMGLDILEKEEIITYRAEEHDLLMSIRNGAFMKEDSTMNDSFFDMVNDYEKRFEYAAKNTSLPSNPDYKKAEDLLMSINKKIVLDKI